MQAFGYSDGNKALSGLLYCPEGAPRAAVAVFPTIWNTTPAVETKAKALADAGYVALIADFYGAQPDGLEQANAWAGTLRADPVIYRQRLHAALIALRSTAGDVPMLAMGFCMGGQAALELARDGANLRAVVSFHGLLDTQRPAAPGTVKARLLVCHGDDDPLVSRGDVLAFWEEMDCANADWHFHSYGQVRHGFTNPVSPPGHEVVAYNNSADHHSWQSALLLFDEVLNP
jgi:dienelactone hydrolase